MNECKECKTINCPLYILFKETDVCPCSYCLVKGMCDGYCILLLRFIWTLDAQTSATRYMGDKVVRIILSKTAEIIYLYKETNQARVLADLTEDDKKTIINYNNFSIYKGIQP